MRQAVEDLLPMWSEIDMDDALELLGPATQDARVRAFAVRQLARADDDELQLYLLQLVQALKFEPTASETRSARSSADALSYENNGLADFLVSRAVQNFILGNSLYWYLVVELALQKDDRAINKMYYKVMFKFQEQLELVRLHSCDYAILLTGTSEHGREREAEARCYEASGRTCCTAREARARAQAQ